MPLASHRVSWVILTMGDRPSDLAVAIGSIREHSPASAIVVVANGGDRPDVDVDVIALPANVGIPAGRSIGAAACDTEFVAFLDDDARLDQLDVDSLIADFDRDESLAVVALRLVDEEGIVARRHVPRPGQGSAARPGAVTNFLGGACVVRTCAVDAVGGYWDALWYGHEELELSWRLIDAGWTIRYRSDSTVFHPRTEISRHADGWRLTGRNRVWIARRDLPSVLVAVHAISWLVLGLVRAPSYATRRAYLGGWWAGWTTSWPTGVERRAISWGTVVHLTRLGRPPII